MKKVLCVFAAALMIAALSTSCNKKCKCTPYAVGVAGVSYEIELDNGQKCADYTAIVTSDPKTGVECKGSL